MPLRRLELRAFSLEGKRTIQLCYKGVSEMEPYWIEASTGVMQRSESVVKVIETKLVWSTNLIISFTYNPNVTKF